MFGVTEVAANGSSGTQTGITVGGVSVTVTTTGGQFAIQRFDFAAFTTAEAQAIIRDIQYKDTSVTYTAGTRSFTFDATDDAGNVSNSASPTWWCRTRRRC